MCKKPNDAQITSDIQNKLSADSGLQGKQLVVQSTDGSVTLSGAVDNDAERDAAAKYASSEPGVKQVVNNLQVGAPVAQAQAPPPAPAPQEPTSAPSISTSTPPPSRHHRHKYQPDYGDASRNNSDNSQAYNNNSQPAPTPAPPPMASVPDNTPPPPPPPQKVTIPSGTSLSVRLIDPINSETAQSGQIFHATLNSPLTFEGDVVVPAGHSVEGHVVNVQSAGKFAGQSLLTLQLDSIRVGPKRYTDSDRSVGTEGFVTWQKHR